MATDTTTAHGDGLADAVGVATHAPDAPGMPQLDFSTFGNQIFWLVVALFAIYMLLSRIALPRIRAILAERQGTITNDIAKSEELKARALEAEGAYQKALSDARAEAQRIVAEAKADIQQELDVAIAVADKEISAKAAESEKAIAEIRAGAVAAVREVANDTAVEIVVAMGGQANASAVEAAVASKMKG